MDVRALPTRVLHEVMTLGNADLLCASLVAWLLDAEAEHKLGTLFVHRLGAFLEEQELSELAFALQSDMLPVAAELVPRGATADLLVSLADSPRLSIVSIATAQTEPHVLAEYQAMEATPILMSLDDAGDYTVPVWRWRDDLRAIQDQIPAGPFADFVRQFAAYDPAAPDAAGTALNLPPAASAPPPPPPPPPPSKPAPPQHPTSGGGLSDGWMDSGGGLSEGWMNS